MKDDKKPEFNLAFRAAMAFPRNAVAQMALRQHLSGKPLAECTIDYLNILLKTNDS